MALLRVVHLLGSVSVGPWGHRRSTRNAAGSLLDDQRASVLQAEMTSEQVAVLEPSGLGATTSGEGRDRLAEDSDRRADLDDLAAAKRDRSARSRDRQSQTRAPARTSPDALAAAIDRRKSQQDRQHAAGDRARAAQDRENAGFDRNASAGERAATSYDGLTGLYRRDVGIIELEREIARAARTGRPYALAYLDVDGLKARNDSSGHAAGDRLLVQVAEAIRAALRPYDLCIRFGGDEFVCGLLDVTVEEAASRFSLLGIELREADAPISFGLAQLEAGEVLQTLLIRADTAMYDQRKIDIRDLRHDVGPPLPDPALLPD